MWAGAVAGHRNRLHHTLYYAAGQGRFVCRFDKGSASFVVKPAWHGCTQIEMLVEEYVDTVPKGQI